MSALALNAEALYQELLRGVRSLCQTDTRLVGLTSGGAWLAERLQRDLGVNFAGAALALDLMDELELLRTKIRVSAI